MLSLVGSVATIESTNFISFHRIFLTLVTVVASSGRRCRFLGSKVPLPRVEGASSKGRRCQLQGVKVPAPWGLGIISVGLGDTLRTPLEMLLNTLGRYLNIPIGGIGRRDKLYLHQIRALIDSNKGFNWVDKALNRWERWL